MRRIEELEQRVLVFKWRLALCLDDLAELAPAQRRLIDEAAEIDTILEGLRQQICDENGQPTRRRNPPTPHL